MEAHFVVKLDKKITNAEGVVAYNNIPVGKYIIEVQGNHDF